jgi:hypothetical protein
MVDFVRVVGKGYPVKLVVISGGKNVEHDLDEYQYLNLKESVAETELALLKARKRVIMSDVPAFAEEKPCDV